MGTFTILDPDGVHAIDARIIDDQVIVDHASLTAALGWTRKPEGLCRGDVCIPVAPDAGLDVDDGIELGALARTLRRPLALDVDEHAAFLGESASSRSEALSSLVAPDFSLPDLDGQMHSLAEHRGKKVFLVAWASW
jgi:hypothetical protein